MEPTDELLTLDELTARVGMSVRNVRFYTSRGLVPPPIRRGRSGFYSADHIARLELVQELQSHGFTLSAIERYVETIPATAAAQDIALHRSMLAPWMSERPVLMTREELSGRAGQELTDDDLATLEALGIVVPAEGPDKYEVAVSQLSIGFGVLDLGYPVDAARAATELYARHGRELAEELYELFRTMVWPRYKDAGMTREQLQQVVERLKPLSITSLVSAFENAMDETRRENIRKRAR